MDIQNFIAEFKKTFIYDMLCESLEDEQLFEHSIVGNQVIWMKEQTRQMWSMWQAAKADAVPQWINVHLLSPQIDTEVLVCVDDDVKKAIYRDADGEGYFEGMFGAEWWMPLPEPAEASIDYWVNEKEVE